MPYLYKLRIFLLLFFTLTIVWLITAGKVSAAATPSSKISLPEITSDNKINTVSTVDDSVFIGGKFNTVTVGKVSAKQQNLALFQLKESRFNGWNPNPNERVDSISLDHQTVFVAGNFTQISGQPRSYLASFQKDNLQLTSWNPQIDGEVGAVVVDGDTVYIAGSFSTVDGQPRSHVASFDITTGRLTDWNPQVNGTVYSLTTDTITIYVGGDFTQVNGQTRKNIASFDKGTGELTSWNPSIDQIVRDIYVDANTVYFNSDKNPFRNVTVVSGSYNEDENTFTYYSNSPVAPTNVQSTPVYDGNSAIFPLSSAAPTSPSSPESTSGALMVNQSQLGFKIPNFSDILTFVIRGFFVLAGITALYHLLMGAFAWITSGGDKDKINESRAKIISAVVGLLVMVAVLAIVVTLEQIVFRRTLCFGLSCPATIPSLIQPY